MMFDYRIIVYVLAVIIILNLTVKKEVIIKVLKNTLEWLLQLVKIITKPKMLLTFGIAWMITNGWSYVFVILGTKLHIYWMLSIGVAYQGFLWMPFTAEKVITVAIAIWLGKLIFPNDKKLQENLSKLNPKNIINTK